MFIVEQSTTSNWGLYLFQRTDFGMLGSSLSRGYFDSYIESDFLAMPGINRWWSSFSYRLKLWLGTLICEPGVAQFLATVLYIVLLMGWSWRTSRSIMNLRDLQQRRKSTSVHLKKLLQQWHRVVWIMAAELILIYTQWRITSYLSLCIHPVWQNGSHGHPNYWKGCHH